MINQNDIGFCLLFNIFFRIKKFEGELFLIIFTKKKRNGIKFFYRKKSTLKLQSVLNPHTEMARSLPLVPKMPKIYPRIKTSSSIRKWPKLDTHPIQKIPNAVGRILDTWEYSWFRALLLFLRDPLMLYRCTIYRWVNQFVFNVVFVFWGFIEQFFEVVLDIKLFYQYFDVNLKLRYEQTF